MGTFIKLAHLLVEKGADASATDNSGWNVVHHCVPDEKSKKHVDPTRVVQLAELCQFFISKKCQLDVEDKRGVTALFWACMFGDDGLAPLVQV